MRIDILTVVPELLASPLNESILKRAQEKGLVEIHIHNIRDYTEDKHRTTDDYPFGGEAGMVMKIEPIYRCIEALKAEREYDEVIYTSPDGIRYDQHEANRLSTLDNLIILCGHYKGIDYRIREHLVTREISIGDYVLTGGELARKFPDRQFVVTGVSWLDRSIYEQYIADSGIRYVCDQTYETLAAAEAAVVTSGTATLETALLNVPEVVVYRTLWFQVKLQPYVLKVPYVSLVNLNLGRESVVEIIQSDLDITRAERELRAILTGGEKRERMLRDFAELQAVIGAPGASDRFAARMVELLKKQVR